jgi:hypothetical protein
MNQMWKKKNWMAVLKIYRGILWNKKKKRKKEKEKIETASRAKPDILRYTCCLLIEVNPWWIKPCCGSWMLAAGQRSRQHSRSSALMTYANDFFKLINILYMSK